MLKPLRRTFINRSYRDNTVRHNASPSARTYIRVHLRLLENAGHVIDFHRLHFRRATGNGALLDHRAHCPSRTTSAAIAVPKVNAVMMSLHLDAIAKAVDPGAHAAVLLNGAGYHRSSSLRVPANITLMPLPRYAPELNTTEIIRECLRENKIANLVFERYDDIIDKARKAWLFLARDKLSATWIANRDRAAVD